jgi:uncharacterized membrane protein YkoI
MKVRTLAVSLISLASVAALAASPTSASRTLGLGQTVVVLESRYPGKVVAIALDDSGDKSAHYHVDMRFPKSGLARLDVDAATLAIASREAAPLTGGSTGLVNAAVLVAAAIPGQMLAAELDAAEGVPAHYDVDVRLPHGAVARLKVDAASRQIGWRSPAIIDDRQ